MKNIKLIIILTITIIFTSCNKDEPENQETQSKFTINQSDHLTPNGYVLSKFYNPNYAHTIFLLDGTIINNELPTNTPIGCQFSNDFTNGIIFEIASLTNQNLIESSYIYNFDYSGTLTSPFISSINIITDIVMEGNCMVSQNIIDDYDGITEGSLTIEEINNNIYTINYTITTNDYGIITGSFRGSLQEANWN